MYTAVDPKATGIDFVHRMNRDPRVSPELRIGSGVALGDFDSDGLVDVFLPCSTDRGRLYRNLGGFRFEDVTEKAGIGGADRWTTGASFVDIDNDGDLDLYVCGHGCPNHLYINRGDGTFDERGKQYGLNHVGASVMMAFADYDSDGDLDGYLVTNHIPPDEEISYNFEFDKYGVPHVPKRFLEYRDTIRRPDGQYVVIESGHYDYLYRNNGDGTFSDVSEAAKIRGDEANIRGNDRGLAVTWWDYNDDNRPDIYVANDFFGADRLYRNNGDGTFTDVIADVMPHTPWFSMGCDSGDLNNDGLFDLIGTDMSERTDFRSKMTRRNLQVAGWFLEQPTPRQYTHNAVYLNTGANRFNEIAYMTRMDSTDWTWSVRCVDMDLDGRVDVHFTNGMSLDFDNNDMKLEASKLEPVDSEAYRRYWDKQGPLRQRNYAFRNLGNLAFSEVSHEWGLDHLGLSFGAAFGDLDNDGDLDLIVNRLDDTASVCRNDGVDGHSVRLRLKGITSNRFGVGTTVRVRAGGQLQSSYLTLSRGFMSASDPTLHFGLGDADSIDELVVRWPSGQLQSFTHVLADRLYTITEPDESPHPSEKNNPDRPVPLFARSEAIESLKHSDRLYNDFAREPLLPIRLSQLGPGVAVGDVNGDRIDDLFLGGATGDSGSMAISDGRGRWSYYTGLFSPWGEDVDREDMGVLLFDAEGDGDQDLFLASGGVECEPNDESLRDRLFLNDGAGHFTRAAADQVADVRDSGSVAAAADFDRDGDLDLFVGSRCVPGRFPKTPYSRLLENEAGRFRDATAEVAPEVLNTGLVTSGLWTDVNDDGWIDLLVTHDWGPIKLFINHEGRLRDATRAAGLTNLLGWWNGIAGRDLDGDGDIDYVATNLGRNTSYRVTQDRPATLFYGNFSGEGQSVLVEGKYDEQGRLVPRRGKLEVEQALPLVEVAFPTFQSYAAATLADVVGEQALKDAVELTVNTEDSVVLRNDGRGRFDIEPLPIFAQIAPGFGVVLSDFDADGLSDVYLVQNLYSPRREVGRMDGGTSVLLLGQDDGRLEMVSPMRSGLVVPGDAKSVTSTDINDDGWPDLVVGVNDASALVFEHQHVEGRRLASVRLHGKPGNPTGVGARVTTQRSDGQTQTAEVQAGGGYLSQQSATLYFGLGSDGHVVAVEVRWPDGQTSRHTPRQDEPAISIAQP